MKMCRVLNKDQADYCQFDAVATVVTVCSESHVEKTPMCKKHLRHASRTELICTPCLNQGVKIKVRTTKVEW